MAKSVLKGAKLWMAQYDLSGDHSGLALQLNGAAVDVTTFADSPWRKFAGGLKSVAMQHQGLWEAGAGKVDPVLFGNLALADVPVTFSPTGVEDSEAYLFRAIGTEYAPGAAIGDAFAFSASAQGSGELVRGALMLVHSFAAAGSVSSSVLQLGAIGATQKLYIAAHILSLSAGDELQFNFHSDDDQGFATGTNRLNPPNPTAAGSHWYTIDGPITDDWWRFDVALSDAGGGGATASLVLSAGIL